jgi:hypothetical protein
MKNDVRLGYPTQTKRTTLKQLMNVGLRLLEGFSQKINLSKTSTFVSL